MSHHKLSSSSSLSVKASVLTLVVMVGGVLFAAAPSSAMAQQIIPTSSAGLPLPMSPLANETGGGGGGIPTLLPPTNAEGDTVFSTNETGGVPAPLANETGGGGGGIPTLLPPTNAEGDTVFSTNETGGVPAPLANETGVPAPPTEVTPLPTNETGGVPAPLDNETGEITLPPTEGGAKPLTAEIAADFIEGDAPLTVELSAFVAGGIEPYTYSWDFGDGSAGSDQPTVQHIFENPFIYNVTLTVSDATGQVVTANLDITVYEPLPPAEEPPAEEPPAEEPPAEEPPAEEPPAEEPPITGT